MRHWHAHAVSSMAVTPEGAQLCSAGEEAVLVLWQLLSDGDSQKIPRSRCTAPDIQDTTDYLEHPEI